MKKYIDNIRTGQSVIALLSVGVETTRHGEKIRLRKGGREIDSTYSVDEAIRILRYTNAVIEFDAGSKLSDAILKSGLRIVENEPDYNYIDTSHNLYLEF